MKQEWLKKIRLNKGLTQEVVAKRAGMQRPHYTMIETGQRNASVPVAKSIAKVLGFDWTIFFEEECNKMKHKYVV